MEKLTLLAALAVGLSGCQECIDIGCGPALTLSIGGEGFPPVGSVPYRIELALDGHQVNVSCDTERTCSVPRLQYDFGVDATLTEDTIEIEIFGGDELAPTRIDVSVMADGSYIAESTLLPDYRDVNRGEEGCGVCRFAEQDYTLPE
jgi:hypothetical protein